MSLVFGGKRESRAMDIRDYIREVQRHVRSMDREQNKNLRSEALIVKEIYKYAQKNDMTMAKMKAKELVRSRAFRRRLAVTQQGLQCLAQELSILRSAQHSQDVIEKTSKILQILNSKMDLKGAYKMLREFEMQNLHISEKQDLINESLDNIFDVDNSEVDVAMSDVFEELGLKLTGEMHMLKAGDLQSLSKHTTDSYVDDIEQRFLALKANHK
jgi:hypothetical protein